MLLKLALVVMVIAATGAGLLTVRQQRLEAVHDMAKALDRAAALEQQVWRMRIDAARLTSPQHAHDMLARLGETHPIVAPWVDPFTDTINEYRFAAHPESARDGAL